ncbi:hypothetical protein ACVOMV_25780 [Mesorhizobium atlanticum]
MTGVDRDRADPLLQRIPFAELGMQLQPQVIEFWWLQFGERDVAGRICVVPTPCGSVSASGRRQPRKLRPRSGELAVPVVAVPARAAGQAGGRRPGPASAVVPKNGERRRWRRRELLVGRVDVLGDGVGRSSTPTSRMLIFDSGGALVIPERVPRYQRFATIVDRSYDPLEGVGKPLAGAPEFSRTN